MSSEESLAVDRSSPSGPPEERPQTRPSPVPEQAPREPARGSSPSLAPRRRKVERERYEALTRGRKALLCVDSVTVSFDGFKALDALTLVLDEGELRCIIGPNGAGKTTLMDVITGKTEPDSGSVFLVGDETDLTHLREYEIVARGVCRKFQRPTVFQGHSVFENLELARPGQKGVFQSLFARLSRAEREQIERILETIGLKDEAATRAGLLSHGQKQWLEIGMLLAQEPRVLLVDEPVAGMTQQESERTAQLLNSLAGERTVVVVEHDMEFVRSIAKTVTVLHEGRVLAEGNMDHVQNDPRVIEVYLGQDHGTERRASAPPAAKPVAEPKASENGVSSSAAVDAGSA